MLISSKHAGEKSCPSSKKNEFAMKMTVYINNDDDDASARAFLSLWCHFESQQSINNSKDRWNGVKCLPFQK